MRLALFLTLLLTGCATTSPQVVEVPKVVPDVEIMASCPAFLEPTAKDGKSLLLLDSKNYKIYLDCNKLNEEKKKFIKKL